MCRAAHSKIGLSIFFLFMDNKEMLNRFLSVQRLKEGVAMKRIQHIISVLIMLVILAVQVSGQASTTLTMESGSDDQTSVALSQYQKDTKVQVLIDSFAKSKTTLLDMLYSRNAKFDIYRPNTNQDTFQAVKQKGYYVDLADKAAIASFTKEFLPVVQQVIVQDDQIVAVPTGFTLPYAFSVNSRLLSEMGLSKDDLPKNMMELFDWIDAWDEAYGKQFPDVVPFFSSVRTERYNNPMMQLVLEMYRDYALSALGELNYDTQEFRQLMERIAAYQEEPADHGDNWMADYPQQHNTLIYCQSVHANGIFHSYEHQWIAPLSLMRDAPAIQPFYVKCAFVNPYATHIEDAVTLLSYYASMPNDKLRCAISASLAAPLEDEAFQGDFERAMATKANAEEMLLSDDLSIEQREEYEWNLSIADEYIMNGDRYRYVVSPSSLENYQNVILPYLYARGMSAYESDGVLEQLTSFITRYVDGELPLEQCIKQMNNTIKAMVLESGGTP